LSQKLQHCQQVLNKSDHHDQKLDDKSCREAEKEEIGLKDEKKVAVMAKKE
jgi:hypothetical protein